MLPPSTKYAGQRFAILGTGTSGQAAARLARQLGAEVVLLDDNAAEAPAAAQLRAEGFAVRSGPEARADEGPYDLVILSPGIDPSWPLAQGILARGVPGLSEIEFAYQQTAVPVIAVTGTNGKTTTTGLIAHVLGACGRRAVPCGNYGTALSEVVLRDEALDVLVIEVSSFQLEMIHEFRPVISVWMNFAPDHLDRHPSLEAYRAAKLRIFENQRPEDTAVVKGDEPLPGLTARRVSFSAWQPGGDWSFRDGIVCAGGSAVLALADTRLRGRHNAENIMAALAAVSAWGVPLEEAAAHVATFIPPRHRCEVVATLGGREFLNDSKATNIHAVESALRGQERPVVLIAGGKDKGLDYAPMLELIREKASAVFTIGEIGPALAITWPGAVFCRGLEEAVVRAFAAAAPSQTILFSPGTSSFDMFTGYGHRGEVFCQIVHQLQHKS